MILLHTQVVKRKRDNLTQFVGLGKEFEAFDVEYYILGLLRQERLLDALRDVALFTFVILDLLISEEIIQTFLEGVGFEGYGECKERFDERSGVHTLDIVALYLGLDLT